MYILLYIINFMYVRTNRFQMIFKNIHIMPVNTVNYIIINTAIEYYVNTAALSIIVKAPEMRYFNLYLWQTFLNLLEWTTSRDWTFISHVRILYLFPYFCSWDWCLLKFWYCNNYIVAHDKFKSEIRMYS